MGGPSPSSARLFRCTRFLNAICCNTQRDEFSRNFSCTSSSLKRQFLFYRKKWLQYTTCMHVKHLVQEHSMIKGEFSRNYCELVFSRYRFLFNCLMLIIYIQLPASGGGICLNKFQTKCSQENHHNRSNRRSASDYNNYKLIIKLKHCNHHVTSLIRLKCHLRMMIIIQYLWWPIAYGDTLIRTCSMSSCSCCVLCCILSRRRCFST